MRVGEASDRQNEFYNLIDNTHRDNMKECMDIKEE